MGDGLDPLSPALDPSMGLYGGISPAIIVIKILLNSMIFPMHIHISYQLCINVSV